MVFRGGNGEGSVRYLKQLLGIFKSYEIQLPGMSPQEEIFFDIEKKFTIASFSGNSTQLRYSWLRVANYPYTHLESKFYE